MLCPLGKPAWPNSVSQNRISLCSQSQISLCSQNQISLPPAHLDAEVLLAYARLNGDQVLDCKMKLSMSVNHNQELYIRMIINVILILDLGA